MIRHVRLVCCLIVLGLAGVAQAKPFRVLAFYSTNVEQDHVDFAMQAIPFFQEMAKRDHFDFKATSNWDDMNPTVLKDYQVPQAMRLPLTPPPDLGEPCPNQP